MNSERDNSAAPQPLDQSQPSISPGPRSAHPDRLSRLARDVAETIFIALALFVLFRLALQNFRVEGFSMEPNFHNGQYILVNKIEYLFRSPQRGDAIVLVPPNDAERDYIKRIIGLPGERVEIFGNQITVNGKILVEPYLPNPGTYNLQPTTIPPDSYFVLGDNRDYSNDSHLWGTITHEKIIGKAWFIYWPPQSIGLIPNYSPDN